MIKINIQPFTLPAVTSLHVKNLGEPFKKEVAPGQFAVFRRIYFELQDELGKIRELGEVDILESIYSLCGNFVLDEVPVETLTTINAFFQQSGWENIVAINLES